MLFLWHHSQGIAQSLLERKVSVDLEQQPASQLLELLSKSGQVLFSYNSDIITPYNQVTVHAKGKSIRQVLDQAFEGNMHYKERGKYIILLEGGERSFVISGYIQNGHTGEKISNVTVYESQLLASAMTNEQGYFRLPLKNREKNRTVSLTVRKEAYTELSLNLNSGYDQELVLPIVPATEVLLEDVVIHKQKVESTWISRFFLSSRQQIQALNIGAFIARRPLQTSLLPGIGTHGIIGAHVVNKFSLNMLGGYTAGVNGVEIGGLFNIDKGNVTAVQVAGVFNNVGGDVSGVQIGGVYNNVIGTTRGLQIGGVINRVQDTFSGTQIGGVTNLLRSPVSGLQIAGVNNYVRGTVTGIQIAGVANTNDASVTGIELAGVANWNNGPTRGLMLAGVLNQSTAPMTGIQMAGLVNIATKISGMQIGVVNIADSLDGYCIGLVNYARNGRHNILTGANEIQNISLGYRSGTDHLYSLLILGASSDPRNQSYSFSYGIGTTLLRYRKWSWETSLLAQGYYLGDWTRLRTGTRLQTTLSYAPLHWLSLYAGPAYMAVPEQEPVGITDFMPSLNDRGSHVHAIGDLGQGWLGWQFGLSIF